MFGSDVRYRLAEELHSELFSIFRFISNIFILRNYTLLWEFLKNVNSNIHFKILIQVKVMILVINFINFADQFRIFMESSIIFTLNKVHNCKPIIFAHAFCV